jgi:hypothetical protein
MRTRLDRTIASPHRAFAMSKHDSAWVCAQDRAKVVLGGLFALPTAGASEDQLGA